MAIIQVYKFGLDWDWVRNGYLGWVGSVVAGVCLGTVERAMLVKRRGKVITYERRRDDNTWTSGRASLEGGLTRAHF
jgi:hypothetical protein